MAAAPIAAKAKGHSEIWPDVLVTSPSAANMTTKISVAE